MPRVAAILVFSVALLLCCGFSPTVHAQVPEPDASPAARKLDEFGNLRHCDLTGRLDNLANFVHETPRAEAHIIYYGPPGAEESQLKIMGDYLVESRGVLAKQIKTIYGGRNSNLKLPKIELWIVPPKAIPPAPQNFENVVDTFKGMFDEGRAMDRVDLEFEDEMGPGLAATTYPSFADILNQQTNAIGYVVVYSGEDAAPGAWRRIAQDEIDYLKKMNVDPARVKMIFGGHRKKTTRQLWVMPKDSPPPVKDAGPELPLAKAVKIDDFDAGTLFSTQNETNVFTRLKEVLTAQKNVRAFVVVRLEVPDPEEALDIDEGEEADLTKLVEKWRVELANTHKIGPDRFIVLFTTAPDFQASHLRLWIVPKGQALPNPHEEDEPDDGP